MPVTHQSFLSTVHVDADGRANAQGYYLLNAPAALESTGVVILHQNSGDY